MLLDLIIYGLNAIATVFLAILPASTFWPLPAGITAAFSWVGAQMGTMAAFLPSGVLPALASASTLVVSVNLFVIPWLAARGFRLPFAALSKPE